MQHLIFVCIVKELSLIRTIDILFHTCSPAIWFFAVLFLLFNTHGKPSFLFLLSIVFWGRARAWWVQHSRSQELVIWREKFPNKNLWKVLSLHCTSNVNLHYSVEPRCVQFKFTLLIKCKLFKSKIFYPLKDTKQTNKDIMLY